MKTDTFDFLFLCDKEVKQCISYKEGIAVIEEAWKKIAADERVLNFRSKLLPVGQGRISAHAADVNGDYFGTFLLTVSGADITKPSFKHLSDLFTLWDAQAGVPVFMMSTDTYTRQVKTGCSSALTAKYLARKDSSKLGLIGAGGEATGHFLAMREVFNLEEVKIFDISKEALNRFVNNMSNYGVKIKPADSVEQATRGCDIVVTATSADAPLVKKDWLEKGMLLIKIGSNQELEPEIIMSADKVIVDWWDYVKIRSKEIDLLLKKGSISEKEIENKKFIYAELPEIAVGRKAGRENDDESILAIPLTMPVEHLELAKFVFNRAVKEGMGTKINLMSR